MYEKRTYSIGEVTVNFDARRVPIKASDRKPGQFPYYGASGIVDYVDDYLFDGEYLLIAEDGENLRTRKTPIAFMATGRFWVNNHAHVVQGNHLANTRYLCYALANTDISGYLSGSTQPKLTQAALSSVKLQLPSRQYQDAVIEVLGALDDKIAANERIVTTCDGLAQAYMACAVADTERVRLADLASITMGSSPPGETYNEAGIGLPFYQGTRDFGVRFPTRRVWCSEPVRVASPGSILVSVRAPVGRLNVTAEECCIGRGLAALVSKYGTPSVLYHSLRTTPKIWQPFESEGTVFGAINKRQLEDLSVPAFDAATAMRLEELLSSLDEYVRRAFQENLALIQLRDTLLPGLMSGAIRVRDAERIAEDVT